MKEVFRIILRLFVISVCLVALILCLNMDEKSELAQRKAQAFVIYKAMVKHTGASYAVPKFSILESKVINAYASQEGIVVTTGMLKFVQNYDQLAAVIGHEIGHVLLGHTTAEDGIDSRIHEANADKYGTYLMLRTGYNVCEAGRLWAKMARELGNDIMTSTHPSHADRVYSLEFPSCWY